MNKSSADVEREVEASRSQLDRNVEALKEKMTPGQLLDEAMHSMGGAGQQVASRFFEQAKQNPMPLAVMGLGLAWLMASNNSGGSAGSRPSGRGASALGAPEDGALGQFLKDKASAAVDGAHESLDQARGALADRAGALQDSLGGAADKAADLTQKARQGISQAFENEPLLGGALGFFVGLAVGAALPPTEAEDKLMGRAHDRLVDKGKDLAQTTVEQASSAAQSAYQGAKSELQAGGDGELSDKVAAAVKTGIDRAQAELKPH